MTDKQPDVFTHNLNRAVYIVAITMSVVVETGDEAVSVEIRRGLYGFSSYKKARAFKASCNSAQLLTEPPVAFLFSRHAIQETNND